MVTMTSIIKALNKDETYVVNVNNAITNTTITCIVKCLGKDTYLVNFISIKSSFPLNSIVCNLDLIYSKLNWIMEDINPDLPKRNTIPLGITKDFKVIGISNIYFN